jgi:hypothetical protein
VAGPAALASGPSRPARTLRSHWDDFAAAAKELASKYLELKHLNTIKQIGSALLATALWWLVLLGINLHIH